MVMKINYGRWHSMQAYGPFSARRPDEPLYVQFSGGRTSGFMATMAPEEAIITFENTGKEHRKTLEFVRNVGDAIGKEIVWLEWRPPKNLGDPPRKFMWERVNFDTADRKGDVFVEFMRYINAYREVCGKPPISPWVRSRICTAYLKHKVLDNYVRDQGIYAHDRWIGLRADEPDRVVALRRQETRDKTLSAPLYEAGVVKADIVDEFWPMQSFDLGIEEYDGNCDGCFLKDQADISRSIGTSEEKTEWWGSMQDKYPMFGGKNFPKYRDLAYELPTRIAIEEALRSGREPRDDGRLPARRFKLVMIQERKRFENGPSQFSCACESSMMGGDGEEDDEG